MLTDPYAPDWLDWLDRHASENRSAARCHILIDGAFVPGLHSAFREALPDADTPRLLFEGLPGCNDATRDVSPFVITWAPGNKRLRKVLRQCEGWPMVSAITTAESIDPLAQRLAQWCIVEVDAQRFNLRFADTRRLSAIVSNLSPVQRAHFAGAARAWHCISREGRWGALDVSAEPSAAPSSDTRLSPDAFAAMVQDGEADALLTVLRDRGRSWERPAGAHRIVERALESATAASLADGERLGWCEACLDDEGLLADGHAQQNAAQWLQENRA